jgi:prefoldin alpha subunit
VNDEEAQKAYFEFMELQQQAENLQQHIQQVQEQIRNIHQTRQTISELQKIEASVESWMHIAPGAFIKATAKPVDTILLNIGAGVAVEKKPEQVLETLLQHEVTLEEILASATKEFQETLTKLESIRKKVE